MTAPNRNTLWARALVDELAAAGVDAACIAPGSRSTPLTIAFTEREEIRVLSHLDERSAAYFALGRGRRTGRPTPVVSTSGTATANFHPAVMEADRGRVPLLVLTADRPPELRDSGANQTADQMRLYGDAARWFRDLPEPEADARKLRSLRVAVGRAVAEASGVPAGPVHLNVPFRKPLEPVEVPDDVPDGFADEHPLAATGRTAPTGRGGATRPFVRTTRGRPTLEPADLTDLAAAIDGTARGLVVAGPADPPTVDPVSADRRSAAPGTDAAAIADLAAAAGFPVLADPLSGLRFGEHVAGDTTVLGGYDAFLDRRVTSDWPDPDVVLRFGAAPTSKALREYLSGTDARQFLVDPAGEWREATFTASDLVVADPGGLARALADRLDRDPNTDWHGRLAAAESAHWEAAEAAPTGDFEGAVLAAVADLAPDPATVFVSNSMPVRDLDRFGRPRAAALTVLGNRGVSGIDGVTSTALGAGSATEDPLVLVAGDLAYYHDLTGLLAIERCGVDATVVLVNNDGGGIFHMLPIEAYDPPFTDQFKTPHGLDFAPTGDLFDLGFERVEDHEEFRAAFAESVASAGTQVVEVRTDAEASHRTREALQDALCAEFG